MKRANKKGKDRAFSFAQRAMFTLLGFALFVLFALFYTRGTHSPLAMQLSTAQALNINRYDEIEISGAQEESVSNDRMAISVRSNKVDFIVFYRSSSNQGYPRYLSSELSEGLAVGHILVSSYNDRIELTGTRKAYEIRDGQVLEYPIRMNVDFESYIQTVISIQADPSIAGLKAYNQNRRSQGRR